MLFRDIFSKKGLIRGSPSYISDLKLKTQVT